MNMESTTMKAYADENGLVTFVCQDCARVQKEQAQAYKGVKMPVRIQCKCGNVYEVEIEFRKFYRKETNLEGIYSTAQKSSDWGRNWGNIIVIDLTMQGCKFETLKANLLNPYEEIEIEFYLKNDKNSLIKKRALVRYISQNYVGCEFIELPGSQDPDLGFYLMKLKKRSNARRFERCNINQGKIDQENIMVIVERQLVNLVNISVGGIYVVSKSPFPLGKVNISVNIKDQEKIELTGHVVRKENKGNAWGIAIYFLQKQYKDSSTKSDLAIAG